jgi:hypothetical protein
MSATDDMQIAQTILEQLGGRRFMAMTGAQHFTAVDSGLTFRLPGTSNERHINYVKIILEPSDTYTMTFATIRHLDLKLVAESDGVYFDQLQDTFTAETGLDTHL